MLILERDCIDIKADIAHTECGCVILCKGAMKSAGISTDIVSFATGNIDRIPIIKFVIVD